MNSSVGFSRAEGIVARFHFCQLMPLNQCSHHRLRWFALHELYRHFPGPANYSLTVGKVVWLI